MADRPLGMQWRSRGNGGPPAKVPERASAPVNTRTSLWPERWPAIALQECIDEVEAAPPDERAQVKFNLPCQDCYMNSACLNAKRKESGPLLYDRELQTRPRSSESSLFPYEVFAPMLDHTNSLVPYWRPPFSLEHQYAVVQAWDLAWSEKIGGDYLVCVTAYVHKPTGKRVLLDLQRWQRLSFKEQCTLIEDRAKTYNADIVVIEGDAAQRIWSKHMADTTDVPVKPHDAGGTATDAGKRDLIAGVPGLLITFENHKWDLPYQAGSYHHDEVANLLTEFEAFGWNDGKLEGVGEHDDAVMAFWHCEWGCRLMMGWDIGGTEFHRGVVPGAR